MDDLNEKRIVVESVNPDSGGQLLQCYFKQHGNTYTFHDKDEKVKAGDIKLGEEFFFTLDEDPDVNWTMVITLAEHRPDRRTLFGNWNDSRNPSLADGEFQAQAGGSGEEEEPNAASAYA